MDDSDDRVSEEYKETLRLSNQNTKWNKAITTTNTETKEFFESSGPPSYFDPDSSLTLNTWQPPSAQLKPWPEAIFPNINDSNGSKDSGVQENTDSNSNAHDEITYTLIDPTPITAESKSHEEEGKDSDSNDSSKKD